MHQRKCEITTNERIKLLYDKHKVNENIKLYQRLLSKSPKKEIMY